MYIYVHRYISILQLYEYVNELYTDIITRIQIHLYIYIYMYLRILDIITRAMQNGVALRDVKSIIFHLISPAPMSATQWWYECDCNR